MSYTCTLSRHLHELCAFVLVQCGALFQCGFACRASSCHIPTCNAPAPSRLTRTLKYSTCNNVDSTVVLSLLFSVQALRQLQGTYAHFHTFSNVSYSIVTSLSYRLRELKMVLPTDRGWCCLTLFLDQFNDRSQIRGGRGCRWKWNGWWARSCHHYIHFSCECVMLPLRLES